MDQSKTRMLAEAGVAIAIAKCCHLLRFSICHKGELY